MEKMGIIRNLDILGRIVIPKELRNFLFMEVGDPIEIYVEDDTVILKKYQRGCSCCGEMKGLVSLYGVSLCPSCRGEFKRLENNRR